MRPTVLGDHVSDYQSRIDSIISYCCSPLSLLTPPQTHLSTPHLPRLSQTHHHLPPTPHPKHLPIPLPLPRRFLRQSNHTQPRIPQRASKTPPDMHSNHRLLTPITLRPKPPVATPVSTITPSPTTIDPHQKNPNHQHDTDPPPNLFQRIYISP